MFPELDMTQYIIMQTIGSYTMPKGTDRMIIDLLVVDDMPDKEVMKQLKKLEKKEMLILTISNARGAKNKLRVTELGRKWLRKERLGKI